MHTPTVSYHHLEAKERRMVSSTKDKQFKVDTYELHENGLYFRIYSGSNDWSRLEAHILPKLKIQVVRFQWQTTALAAQYPYDYYLDTIRVVETADPWIVRDLYLDILVYEGKRAEVVDTDDYLAAQSEGHFEAGEADFALNATHDTLNALANHGYSLRMWLESRNINLTWL